MSGGDDEALCVKIRGLPWTATKQDILEFFSDCTVEGGVEGVHLITSSEGRSSGEAFVQVPAHHDINKFTAKDKKSMGHRYIEVFKVKRAEMEWYLNRTRPTQSPSVSFKVQSQDCETFIRLRGLPFECTKEDILQFFEGLEMGGSGIQLMVDNMGRSSGESYVQFASKEHAQKALAKDRQCIGHRYIEVFRVSPSELRSITMSSSMRPSLGGGGGGGGGGPYRSSMYSNQRPTPYDRGGRSDYHHQRTDSQSHSSSHHGRGYGGAGGGGGGGPQRPQQRYYSKGFEDDIWSGYGNGGGVGSSWNRGGLTPPPPPPPLMALKRGSAGGGGGGRSGLSSGGGSSKNCVLMRGLPFKAGEEEIRAFFEPLVPTSVDIIYESSGRPSGTAKVQFASGDDVTRAMGKHKDRMEHRYIELFLHSS